jgi:hypothetical protein
MQKKPRPQIPDKMLSLRSSDNLWLGREKYNDEGKKAKRSE